MQDDSDAPGLSGPSLRAVALARAIRRARGEMRQVDFSDLLGVAQSVVSTWENAKVTPSVETLAMVEERLGLPLGSLAGEAGFFTAEGANPAGWGGFKLKELSVQHLEDALRMVRSADDLGFGVRLRPIEGAGGSDARWLVEVMASNAGSPGPGEEVTAELK